MVDTPKSNSSKNGSKKTNKKLAKDIAEKTEISNLESDNSVAEEYSAEAKSSDEAAALDTQVARTFDTKTTFGTSFKAEAIGIVAVIGIAFIGFQGFISIAQARGEQFFAMLQAMGSAPPPLVTTVSAKQVNAKYSVTYPAIISAFEPSQVRAQSSGRITDILFSAGQKVKKDQVLFKVDDEPIKIAIHAAKTRLNSAVAGYEAASKALKRAKSLAELDSISNQDLESIEANYKQAKAAVSTVKAEIKARRYDLKQTKVKAQKVGFISAPLVKIGDLVSPTLQSPLAVIDDDSSSYINTQIPVSEMLAMKKNGMLRQKSDARSGTQVKIWIDALSDYYPFMAEVDYIARQVNTGTNTVTVRAVVPNKVGKLLEGMFIKATFTEESTHNAVLVPHKSIKRQADGVTSVHVVAEDGSLSIQQVKLGSLKNSFVEVISGVNPGEQIVSEGIVKLLAGAKTVSPELVPFEPIDISSNNEVVNLPIPF